MQPDFSTAVNLLLLTNAPPESTFTAQLITNPTAFRYVRYLSPNGGYGNIAEAQFYSSASSLPVVPSAPTGLGATAGDKQIQLAWNASPGATNYNIKRALVTGGPYTLVGTSTALLHMDSGLAPGTYYYVVSALSGAGESPNSGEAYATVTCSVPAAPATLAITAQPGELLPAWSAVAGATSYNLFRANSMAGPFGLLAGGLTATNYADYSAASSVTYFYLVQALNSCGPGTNSAVAGISTLPLPPLALGMQSGQLSLSWPSWAGNYSAYTATNLVPPVLWQPVPGTPQSSNASFYLSLPTTNSSQEFFRLHAP